MVKKWLAQSKHAVGQIRDFLDEKTIHSPNLTLSRLQKFAHFWLMVGKSFARNRCPVHASALAYTTLLALIPMLFLVVSVSSSILRQEGGQRVEQFINRMLVSMTPPVSGTNVSSANPEISATNNSPLTANAENAATTNASSSTNSSAVNIGATNSAAATGTNAISGRQEFVQQVNRYVQNIQSGTLGVTGIVGLVIVAILMLRSIESTFNTIWGVVKGRNWWAQIMQYSAVLLLGPVLLGVALALANGAHLQSTKQLLGSAPFISRLLFGFAPVVLLCLAFSVFYVLMPNTKVHWSAALVGGAVGGLLWHFNNYFSVLYISRWITNSKIYGSLAVIPVFMAGLYFSWLILLFGAQVAYAFQNRSAYLQAKQCDNVNQRGREFVALRLMEHIGARFQRGKPPAIVSEMADSLSVPSRLIQQVMQTLLAARLVVEVAGAELAYAPARPLELITCHDILLALRAGQGQELATRDEPARAGVFGEFEKILEAEQRAAACVTVRAMVDRTEHLAALSGKPVQAVADKQSE
ncbi:MAG: hypothetical protein JWQ04_3270 [Pedosphaera sp.]|nr:hypothetical protein [Pedosphaera sp.]